MSLLKKHLSNCHGYADDTQLYMSFRPGTNVNEQAAVRALEACIQDVRSWMINNRLMINDSKTEFLLVGTQFQLKKVNIDSIQVGNSTVMPVSSVQNLSSYFDNHMSMDTHISSVCSKAFCGLYRIRKIRKFLNEKSTLRLAFHIHALWHVWHDCLGGTFDTNCHTYETPMRVAVPMRVWNSKKLNFLVRQIRVAFHMHALLSRLARVSLAWICVPWAWICVP